MKSDQYRNTGTNADRGKLPDISVEIFTRCHVPDKIDPLEFMELLSHAQLAGVLYFAEI